ncbi:hypothetical protein [Microbacterium sp. UCD-TDU]|uniref:hypothetical protein n=1 Tax=Microbacterium sp. UCD-TDU TaxID=1247714 RepID=UPI000349895E|nr:hypothetical protein [Microbacterium sp. UCD-TDU]EYT59755.1 hypothetical protein D514_0111625 [Microbacterium sp. UCD-TDU]
MGSTKINGKRIFDDVYAFPQDSQALADDIWDAYVTRIGTASARGLIPPGELRDGIVFRETDTGLIWLRDAGDWKVIGGRTPSALMRRTATTLSAATGDYRNISATAAWSATGGQMRGGMSYNNGIIVPIDGWYEVGWALRGLDPAPATIVGIAVNKDTGVGGDDMWAIGHMLVNIVTIGTASARVKLNANDKLTLFAYASSGTTTIVPNPSAGKVQTSQWGARWVEAA